MAGEQTLITNPAKQTLKSDGPIVAFNVLEYLRPAVTKIVAQAGCDMLLIETEHVMHDGQTLDQLHSNGARQWAVSARDRADDGPRVRLPDAGRGCPGHRTVLR